MSAEGEKGRRGDPAWGDGAVPAAPARPKNQIPPDLVVKSQDIDIAEIILSRIRRPKAVQTLCRNRISRFEQLSTSEAHWSTTKSGGMWAFLFSCDFRTRMTTEDMTMTVRELRSALAPMEATHDVQVVLFKNDGTSQVFELEEVLSNNGHAQLEIYEAEEVETVTESGDDDDHS
jgi:hypothetical protein